MWRLIDGVSDKVNKMCKKINATVYRDGLTRPMSAAKRRGTFAPFDAVVVNARGDDPKRVALPEHSMLIDSQRHSWRRFNIKQTATGRAF